MIIPVAIVEDEPWVRRLLIGEIAWKKLGISLSVEAENGPQALSLCRLHKPRIVFTDIRLPGFDGLELIERLVTHGRGSRFIIISGHADFTYAQRALRLGVKDYLLKPVRGAEIQPILERMIEEIKSEDDARGRVEKTERQNQTLQAVLREKDLGPASADQSTGDLRISKAIGIIRARMGEQITLDDVAVSVGMSRSSFAEHFRKETGRSFVDFLNNERIAAARELLEHPEFSIAEIAKMVGYTDPNYFARVFKTHLLQSPGEYRDAQTRR